VSITSVTVLKNEEWYVGFMLQSILPHVKKAFILDTGSVDRTIGIIESYAKSYGNVELIRKSFGKPNVRFDSTYDEIAARNYILDVAKKSNPEQIFSIDADEIYNKFFWSAISEETFKNARNIGHQTHTLLTANRYSAFPNAFTRWGDNILISPHVRMWNNRLLPSVKWIKQKDAHVILSEDSNTAIQFDKIIENPVHFHLHFLLGPKSYPFWLELRRDKDGLKNPDGHICADAPEEIFSVDATKYWLNKYPDCFPTIGFTPPPENVSKILKHSRILPNKFGLPSYIVDRLGAWQR